MSAAKKRVFDGQDDAGSPTNKKPRTGNAPSFLPPANDLKPAQLSSLAAQQIAAKRAEIQAKIASFSNVPKKVEPQEPAKPNLSEMARKIQEAKRKVEAMAAGNRNPYSGKSQPTASTSKAAPAPAPTPAAGGIHPLLMDLSAPVTQQSKKDRYKPMLPKFASTKGNASAVQSVATSKPVKPKGQLELANAPSLEEARKDPHFDRRLGLETLVPREKKRGRSLRFNQKGKFTRLGDQMRQEARMEALKQRIMEAARKAGMDDEMENTEAGLGKKIKRQPPPQVEWWDAKFLMQDSYDDLDLPQAQLIWENGCDGLVQHPIPIPAPKDNKQIPIKALMLTKKERKKMRRIRRAEILRDHQERVKMGLLPPDPPKVKLSNMMRVLTEEAVLDPTKIEAKVRTEMQLRQFKHEQANQSRKLTPAQRLEKIEAKAAEQEKKGMYAAAFKIKHLQNKSHQFKVRKNAQQLYLTGCCLYAPKFALVIVEGSFAALKKYKRLMLERIDWTEPLTAENSVPADQDDPNGPGQETLLSMADNSCVLVWEGEERDRIFEQFKAKHVPTDHLAREYLGSKAEGIYDSARKLDEASKANV